MSPFHGSACLQATIFLLVLAVAVLATDVQGRHDITDRYTCPPFSCGHLQGIQYPFRLQGDPTWCGSPSYELSCTDSKATIQINTGTYFVTEIHYRYSYFSVVDTNLDMRSSCPLPRRDQRPYPHGLQGSDGFVKLNPFPVTWASFVNCSQAVMNNSDYIPVACLSTGSSFVYVLIDSLSVGNLKPSCGFLAMAALGDQRMGDNNASHGTLVESLRRGFSVQFPTRYQRTLGNFKGCLKEMIVPIRREPMDILVLDWIMSILTIDSAILSCALRLIEDTFPSNKHLGITLQLATVYSPVILKFIAALCRFILAPLVILFYLAHK